MKIRNSLLVAVQTFTLTFATTRQILEIPKAKFRSGDGGADRTGRGEVLHHTILPGLANITSRGETPTLRACITTSAITSAGKVILVARRTVPLA